MILKGVNTANSSVKRNYEVSNNSSKISFTAQRFPSGHYTDWFVKSVKEKFHLPEGRFEAWAEKQIEIFKALRKEQRGFLSVKHGADAEVRRQDYKNLKMDLVDHKLKTEAAEAEHNLAVAAEKVRLEQEKFEVKKNQLTPKFCDLIQMEKEGKKVVVPNGIMVEGPDPQVTKELIEWTGKNSNCTFVQIKHTDDILDSMEKAEARFKDNGNRTLIHVEGFETLIDPKQTTSNIIAGCKSIMSAASDNYHSTLIFDTKDASKLDNAATGPHRVKKIEANIQPRELVKNVPTEPAVEPAHFDEPEFQYSSDKDYSRQNPPKEYYSSDTSSDHDPYDPTIYI